MRRIAIGVQAFVAAAALGAGCRSVEPPLRPDPGATGYAFINPYAVQRYVYPAPIVERAAIEAMADMKIDAVKRTTKPDGVSLKGFMYDGRYTCVAIEDHGRNSIVSVAVDVYGDEPVSKILLERIGIRLATLPQAINPPFDPRAMTDSITHRGQDVEGYRGAPLR
jgi:hypothetical protein